MTPSEPQTETGRALAARAKRESWSNWEGLAQFTIPAIEREAQAIPAGGSVEALREALVRLTNVALVEEEDWSPAVQDDAALAATPPSGGTLIDGATLEQAIRNTRRHIVTPNGGKGSLMPDGWTIAAEYTRLSESSPAEEGARPSHDDRTNAKLPPSAPDEVVRWMRTNDLVAVTRRAYDDMRWGPAEEGAE